MKRLLPVSLVLAAACGPKGPPPDFAPDPGLVGQIREIKITTGPRVCPGETFGAQYTAVLTDGALVPFESRYDRKRPPRLHVPSKKISKAKSALLLTSIFFWLVTR